MRVRIDHKLEQTEFVKDIKKLCDYALEIIDDILKVDPNLKIKITKLKNDFNGMFFPISNEIWISAEQTQLKDVLITLAHELIHAEQAFTGKLKKSYKCGYYKWNDSLIKLDNAAGYKDLPWEKEAFSRQGEVALYIYNKICENYDA